MGSKNLPSLSVGTNASKQSRKYLGEPNDPHYVPKSPLLERRKMSAHEEEELKRTCLLALSDVPHSDEMTDDPFRYLASQITVRQPGIVDRKEEQMRAVEQPSAAAVSAYSGAETVTPSDTSKRETLPSVSTTPMTTPGVTPGETGPRFSDAGKRPVTALPPNSKTEVKSFKANAVYAFLKDPLPAARPQTAASKSMTHLPPLAKYKSKQDAAASLEQAKAVLLSRPDFNKSLPAIPKVKTNEEVAEEVSKEKARGITRILKTVRLQRVQAPHSVPARSNTCTDLTQQQHILEKSTATKHKFSFLSIFQKRGTPGTKRVTVG